VRVALDDAFEHVAARDRADLGDREHLADLDQAGPARASRAPACRTARLHLIDGVVDDVVVADIDAEGLGQLAGIGIGTDVEADDDRAGGLRQVDVGLADRADAAVDDVDPDFVGGQLLTSDWASASCEPCTSALMISGRVLTSPSPIWSNMRLELGGLLLGQLDVAELALTEQRDFARLALVGQRHHLVARTRHVGQAEDLDRDGRTGFVDGLAVLVEHGADAAEGRAGQQHVAATQGTGLHQQRGHRAAALVEAGFDDQALGRGFLRAR
jgi:hypothetical protein